MSTFHKWSDIRPGIVESLGGEEALEDARQQTQAYIDGYRLAVPRTDPLDDDRGAPEIIAE